MKKICIALLFLYSCSNDTSKPESNQPEQSTEGKSVQKLFALPVKYKTVPKNNDGGWYYPNGKAKALFAPGDTVVMKGDYSYVNLDSVTGTAAKPIVFINDSLVRSGVKNSYGWIITNSKYFKIIGRTIGTDKYGFKIGGLPGQYIAQSFTFPSSDNFEIAFVELANAQVGFFANPKTAGSGPYYNIKIHDSYVHHIDNPTESGRSEGVYLGRTDVRTTTAGGSFSNVEIYNNYFEGLAGDGIQVAITQNVYIHHNIIKGYGRANLEQQRSAIIIGGCTSGRIEDNDISGGTGSPFQIFGAGDVFFSRNKAKDVATSANEDGFYIDSKCSDGNLKLHLISNTIDTVSRDYVRDVTKSVVENTGNMFGKQKPPIPPTPTKEIEKTIVLYKDSTWRYQ